MAKTSIATLLTDFGQRDPYVAAMKGVILGICPRARLVDISHAVAAHEVLEAAFILASSAPWFPPGTLHVVVVDPGVGSDRRIMVGRFGGHTFLFPDNGVISLIAESMPLEAIFTVRNTRFLPPAPPSRTFHGRDIFAPVAAEILNGLDISRLGPQPDTYKRLDIPGAAMSGDALGGQVIYIDRFGNLISNIAQSDVAARWPDVSALRIDCAGAEIGPLQGAYAFVDRGRPLALFNSMHLLEVAVNRGRACDFLGADIGAEVRIGP